MKRDLLVRLALLAVMLLSIGIVFRPAPVVADSPKILEFGSMVGVPVGLTAPNNLPIHGVNGAGRPWIIGSAKGELLTNGKLELKFTGLVFDPNDPGVIAAGLANRNTVASMKAVVACITANGGAVQVSTPTFPVTTGLAVDGGGSGNIETVLALPSPCIAPVVFITSTGGNWFAATGN